MPPKAYTQGRKPNLVVSPECLAWASRSNGFAATAENLPRMLEAYYVYRAENGELLSMASRPISQLEKQAQRLRDRLAKYEQAIQFKSS